MIVKVYTNLMSELKIIDLENKFFFLFLLFRSILFKKKQTKRDMILYVTATQVTK